MPRKPKVGKWLSETGLQAIEQMIADGLPEYAAAAKMGIDKNTLTRYKTEYKAITEAIERGYQLRHEAECESIERGFDYLSAPHWIESTAETDIQDAAGNVVGKRVRTVRKQVDPDAATLIFRAKKLMPDKYGDHPHDAEHDAKVEQWENEIADAIRACCKDSGQDSGCDADN